MKQFQSAQYLRAAAALGVVAFHTHLSGPLGQIGVDVFFVISGFIMWLVIQRERRPGDFLFHRLLRIWPLYALATLAAIAVTAICAGGGVVAHYLVEKPLSGVFQRFLKGGRPARVTVGSAS